MSKVHLARSGFITKAALPSITRQRGTTTGTSNLMLFGAGKTTVSNNTTFIDSSTNAFTVTRNGDTVHSGHNPFSTVSDGSAYFDGTGDYLTVPANAAFSFGSGDFTIEFWMYMTSYGSINQNILDFRGSSGSGANIAIYIENVGGTGTKQLRVYDGASDAAVTSNNFPLNTWSHVAVTRNGTDFRFFVNGTQVGSTSTNSRNYSNTAGVYIGAYAGPTAFYFGYISNLRVVKGTAVYTSTFTPPTSALTAITNTQLLLLTDNYSIVNSTPTVLPVTIFGNTTISTAQYPTGMTRSIYFDGTGDYVTVPANAAFNFGSGDFTVECWVNLTLTSAMRVMGQTDVIGTGTSTSILIDVSTSGVITAYIGLTSTTFVSAVGPSSITANTWNHIVATRSGNNFYVYVNGVAGTASSLSGVTLFSSSEPWTVGRNGTNNGLYVNGYISNVRVVKGTAVYTSNFTPSAPLSINISVPNNVTNAIYGVNQLA